MYKVLFITKSLCYGGVERALFDLVRLLNKDIFQPTVFVLHDGGEWVEKFNNEGIRVISSYSGMRAGTNLFRKAKNFIKIQKINSARAHMGKGLLKACTTERYDIVVMFHCSEPYDYLPFVEGAKTVRYIHSDVKRNGSLGRLLSHAGQQLNQYDKFICVSEHARNSFIELFGNEHKTVACHNPIDTEAIISAAKKPCCLPSEPYICSVGRLSVEKGFCRLIEIHKRLLNKGLIHKLVIVGDGSELGKIRNAITESNVSNSVILAGYQENPYPYIKNSIFTVCASYDEGMHLVSLESLCLGVPVVAGVESVRELLGNIPCGIVTKNDDSSLEIAIEKMLADKPFYQQIKSNAKIRSTQLSSRIMTQKVETILLDLLSDSGQH